MSFTTFLQWLYGVIYRVLDWFGDRFSIYLNILNSIYTIISSYVNGMRDAIVVWVNILIANVKTDITNAYNNARGYVNDRFAVLVSLYNDAINTVNGIVNNIRIQLTNDINGARQFVIDLAYSLYNDAKNLATYELNNAKAYLYNTFSWVLVLNGYANTIISFFQPSTLSRVYALITKDFSIINAFMANPIVFMFDLTQDYMLNILGWILAKGLGSTQERIDVKPPWR